MQDSRSLLSNATNSTALVTPPRMSGSGDGGLTELFERYAKGSGPLAFSRVPKAALNAPHFYGHDKIFRLKNRAFFLPNLTCTHSMTTHDRSHTVDLLCYGYY